MDNREIKAYAKVNLHLEVLNRRSDGYHNILSLMANVELHDIIRVEKIDIEDISDKKVDVTIRNVDGIYKSVLDSIAVQDNLISKATNAYLMAIKKRGEAVFTLEKNIPLGAGLGGGSSDAAATLILLNRHFDLLNNNELLSIGTKIGADVPYCLGGGFAICEGIGEILEPIKGNLSSWVLIVNNGIHVDTKTAYASLNRGSEYQTDNIDNKKRCLRSSLAHGTIRDMKSILKNDFEQAVFDKYPEIEKLKSRLYGLGAEFAIMSGSGSSVIGLFAKKKDALKAQSSLKSEAEQVFLTRFINN